MAEVKPAGVEFDTTVPVTQASADAAAAGVAAIPARRDHRHGMPTLAAAPGITFAGGNTTEATTTSTTAVDLLSVASLSIGATIPFLLHMVGRKSAGAAAAGGFGLKANTTIVGEATLNNDVIMRRFGAVDRIETGDGWAAAPSRVAGYLRSGSGYSTIYSATTWQEKTAVALAPDVDWVTVTITDLVVRAISGDALITIGADELHIYSLAVA